MKKLLARAQRALISFLALMQSITDSTKKRMISRAPVPKSRDEEHKND